jgi:hypothetical protein
MHWCFLFLFSFCFFTCSEQAATTPAKQALPVPVFARKEITDKNSWSYYLQHLPEKKGPILDYKGNLISFQQKHATIIDYDIGNRDLQQCADALMRLRAEYLFTQKRYDEIHFHFTSGHDYRFSEYCNGKMPVPAGNSIRFVTVSPSATNHQSLRKYLDLIYAYAGSISLAGELKKADRFGIGTVVITPGSPGHCFIIADEAVTAAGDTVYKLVEGYTPAQSIYVLQNTLEPRLGYWHRLAKGTIHTASYYFTSYQLKTFE